MIPILAACFGVAAPHALSFVVGDQYPVSPEVIFFISLGGAFGGMYFLVTNYIFYSSKTGLLAVVTLSCGAANLAMSWSLVGIYGARGAAYAYCISQILFFLATWRLAALSHPMPWLRTAADLARSTGIQKLFSR